MTEQGFKDWYTSELVKMIEEHRERYRKTHNPVTANRIRDMCECLYNRWLIVIPVPELELNVEKKTEIKQLEFCF